VEAARLLHDRRIMGAFVVDETVVGIITETHLRGLHRSVRIRPSCSSVAYNIDSQAVAPTQRGH
jgi:hypothetical protein